MQPDPHTSLLIVLVVRWILSGLLAVVAVTQPYTIAFSVTVIIAALAIVPSSNKPELQTHDYWRFVVAVALISLAFGFFR